MITRTTFIFNLDW